MDALITYDDLYRAWQDQWSDYLDNVIDALTVGFPVSLLAQPPKDPPGRPRLTQRAKSPAHVKGWQTRRG